jgi:hypothetical protein
MDIHANQMTDKELQAVIVECEKEMQYRRKQFREKLITNFKDAFCALIENGISIRYSDYEQEAERIYIHDVDEFEFFD